MRVYGASPVPALALHMCVRVCIEAYVCVCVRARVLPTRLQWTNHVMPLFVRLCFAWLVNALYTETHDNHENR